MPKTYRYIDKYLTKKKFITWLDSLTDQVFDESSSYTGSLFVYLKQFVDVIRIDLNAISYNVKGKSYSHSMPRWASNYSTSTYYLYKQASVKELRWYFHKKYKL